MYKIMLADDEGIVIDALKFIIEKRFGEKCEIQSAKTGRSVIELAEIFRPDIAIMDIKMPGINGIDAMKEIKKFNPSTIFIVMTAFDKFDYAKEAINLGVLEYLSKPVNREKTENVLLRAMGMIDKARENRSRDLMIKEKLETVVPFIESGLIYTLFFQEEDKANIRQYKELLSIESDFAYVLIFEAGEREENHKLTNEVGSGVRLENCYKEIRETIKDTFKCIVGPVMANKIIVLAPATHETLEYGERILIIERIRSLIHKLDEQFDVHFKAGIGTVKSWIRLQESYQEAAMALRVSAGSVSHANDLEIGCKYEEDYPIETEKRLLDCVSKGEVNGAITEAGYFWNWMVENYRDKAMDIRIKVLDFVLWAENIAYHKSRLVYRFTSRSEYLPFLYNTDIGEIMQKWFVGKIADATRNVAGLKEEIIKSPVERAMIYIKEHYNHDISLDEVSKEVDISPYYFSKLFKEEKGVNFIDYLTGLRIEQAKKMMKDNRISVKEIGIEVGYQDPNYFSRIFKKNVGITPTEYKERVNEKK